MRRLYLPTQIDILVLVGTGNKGINMLAGDDGRWNHLEPAEGRDSKRIGIEAYKLRLGLPFLLLTQHKSLSARGENAYTCIKEESWCS